MDWEENLEENFSDGENMSTQIEIINMAKVKDGERQGTGKKSGKKYLLLDLGSTIHISTSSEGMHQVESCHKAVESANGERTYAKKKGILKFTINDGKVGMGISDTHLLKGFLNDILSMSKLIENGCQLICCDTEKIVLKLPNTDQTMTFLKNGDDGLYYLEVELINPVEQVNNNAAVVSDDEANSAASSKEEDIKEEQVDINCAHELLDHPGEEALRAQAREYNWKLLGTLKLCSSCAQAKATAKGVPSETTKKAKQPGERLFWDLSGPYKQTRGKNKYWGLLVDQVTGRCWSFFKPSKTDFVGELEIVFNKLKAQGFPVKFLRLDNAGEWTHLREPCSKHGTDMEFTAPHTPQFNANVERAFPAIRNMAYACLLSSGMTDHEQKLHWAHAVDDVTIMRNLQPRKGFKNAYKPFGEKPPVKSKDLVKFGAKGWMTLRKKYHPKFTPKAVPVIRVGYATEHSSDTYIVRRLDTNEFVLSRDIKWETPRRHRKLQPKPPDKEIVGQPHYNN